MLRFSQDVRRPNRSAPEIIRLTRLVVTLMLMVALYRWMSEPSTWKWLVSEHNAPLQKSVAAEPRVLAQAAVAPGQQEPGKQPAEAQEEAQEEAQAAEAQEELQDKLKLVTDFSKLSRLEMPAYWRMMSVARAQDFNSLRKHSAVAAFPQLCEQPSRYRGKLLKLRLHIRRILDYEAPENRLGLTRVYEIWGWTDDSRSYPYVVVTDQLPEGFSMGAEVYEEGVFCGYFLKLMSYAAFDKTRIAPLLIGRMESVPDRPVRPAEPIPPWLVVAGGGLLVLLIAGSWWLQKHRQRNLTTPADQNAERWLSDLSHADASRFRDSSPSESEAEAWLKDASGE